MSLRDKLLKNSTIKETSTLSESIYFDTVDFIKTEYPALNIALSGDIDGGATSGIMGIAGPSRYFKTGYALAIAKAYLDKHDDVILLFYDCEFGSPQGYFAQWGIDTSRVVHSPFTSIEMLRSDLMNQLKELKRGDKVCIIIDSVGNAASAKEINDAVAGKEAADMTRAKIIKSLFRMITPYVKMLDIPLIGIQHVYQTMEMYSKTIVSGGQGVMLSADTMWVISKIQEKDKDGTLEGYNFAINIEKSRFVREKMKIPVVVTFEDGIDKYSGMLELAIEFGHVVKPSNGWYSLVDDETGEVSESKVREKDTTTDEFLGVVMSRKSFKEAVKKKYKLN
jgi:hypothetical protein